MYRIPLRFVFDVGKVNQPIKTDLKVIRNLEKSMVKLLELNKVATLPTDGPDGKIIFYEAPCLQSK